MIKIPELNFVVVEQNNSNIESLISFPSLRANQIMLQT
jgi:hypothetical protein